MSGLDSADINWAPDELSEPSAEQLLGLNRREFLMLVAAYALMRALTTPEITKPIRDMLEPRKIEPMPAEAYQYKFRLHGAEKNETGDLSAPVRRILITFPGANPLGSPQGDDTLRFMGDSLESLQAAGWCTVTSEAPISSSRPDLAMQGIQEYIQELIFQNHNLGCNEPIELVVLGHSAGILKVLEMNLHYPPGTPGVIIRGNVIVDSPFEGKDLSGGWKGWGTQYEAGEWIARHIARNHVVRRLLRNGRRGAEETHPALKAWAQLYDLVALLHRQSSRHRRLVGGGKGTVDLDVLANMFNLPSVLIQATGRPQGVETGPRVDPNTHVLPSAKRNYQIWLQKAKQTLGPRHRVVPIAAVHDMHNRLGIDSPQALTAPLMDFLASVVAKIEQQS